MAVYPVSTLNEKSGTIVRKYFRNKTQIAKVVEYGEKSKMREYEISRMDVLQGMGRKYFNFYNGSDMVLSLVKSTDGSVRKAATYPNGFKQFIDKLSFSNTIRNFLNFTQKSKHLEK